jgi:branched-chain amino acid transport system permease protein
MRGSVTLPRVLAFVLAAVVVFTLPAWVGDYWTRIFTGVAMWAGLALAWNIIGGYAGYVSFGHAAFFGLGAYTTALLMQPERHWNFFLTLPVAAAVAAVVAAIVGWPTLKLRGAYFAIATWALAEAVAQLVNVADFTGGSYGLTLPVQPSTSYFFYVMLIAAIVAYAVGYLLLERSRFGYKVKAVRDNEAAAESVGINTTLVKNEAFVISAVIPAVFGGINAYWITFINPPSVLSTEITDQMVVMVLIGGLGHAWGPAVGAAALYIINRQFLAAFGDTTSYIAMVGALVAIVVLFLPDGLASLWPAARRLRLVRQLISGLAR